MTELIPALAQIARRYDAVFCDLWGCLHNGKTPFPKAVSALQSFRVGGGKVVLLTNAPRPKPSVVAQLDAMGGTKLSLQAMPRSLRCFLANGHGRILLAR